jgi:hypothetical protein
VMSVCLAPMPSTELKTLYIGCAGAESVVPEGGANMLVCQCVTSAPSISMSISSVAFAVRKHRQVT